MAARAEQIATQRAARMRRMRPYLEVVSHLAILAGSKHAATGYVEPSPVSDEEIDAAVRTKFRNTRRYCK